MCEEQLLGFIGLCVARHLQPPAINGGDAHVNHLHRLELFKNAARCEARCMVLASLPESHMKAVGQESDEDMRLDAGFELVMNWSDSQIALEITERLFDFRKLNIILP